MRALLVASLVVLGACATLPQATIQTAVEERVRVDGLSGERVQLRNDGPGDLVFEMQREQGPPQTVKIAPGLAWGMALEGLRSIVVTHEDEGAGHLTITVSGRTGGGIRVLPLSAQ
jgi:hypothetical protein